MDKISETKWEECRGLGRSFGYNRAEGEAETIAPDELIHLLVDIVSKNGNLLLDVGPEADGTIPPVQMSRLRALGAWLQQNGEAIYGSQPWKRAVGETAEGIPVRFTRKDSAVYATLMDQPKTKIITLKSFSAKPGSQIYLLGNDKPVTWSQQGDDVRIDLPSALPGRYAYVLKFVAPAALTRVFDTIISIHQQAFGSENSKMNQRFCLTLDLKNDPALIAEYKRYHQKIWPEITKSIKDSGIEDMEIYLLGTRMFMIMEVNERFSFEAKAQSDKKNPKVQEWESLMWKFQQSLPEAKPGEKWLRMERIFKLEA